MRDRLVSADSRHILGLLVLTILIFLAMSLLQPYRFPTQGNLRSMAFQFPEYAILSVAMMTAMLTGASTSRSSAPPTCRSWRRW